MNDFFSAIRRFLLEYLPNQRCVSKNTIRSYKQTLNLFVRFLQVKMNMPFQKIQFKNIQKDLLLGFLDWLENERNCGANTRNQRLMALRSFFCFAGELDCAQIELSLIAQKIPIKLHESKIVKFLSENAMAELLKQPDTNKRIGLRNSFFMILMYDTAARCNELLEMRIRDLRLSIQKPIAYLHGKGKKSRTVPLFNRTVKHCKKYLAIFHPNEPADSDKHLFYTIIHGIQQPMSADTVALFLHKYGLAARENCKEVPAHVHPHMLRHTRAMHLYRQGMPMMLLSEYLGHASEETTKIYAYADTEMKRNAITKTNFMLTDEPCNPIWVDNEEMILKLSGLL